jgi:hypothetical protein
VPVKNQAYRVTLPILDADGDLVTGATGLDSEVSKDGGTFVDCTNEATEIATASGMYYLDLTATEMNADTVGIIVKTTSSGAKTTPMILYPNKSGGLAVNVTAWAGSATATGNIAIKNTLAHGTDITGTPADSAGVTTLLGRVTSTIFTGITSLKEWLGLLAGKQTGNATARTEIRSSGAGSGTFDETTDSQEAVRDRGDAAWVTGAGGDPWATAVPGAYAAGTAGNILGNRLDAAISTRATPAQVQTELGTYGALKPTTVGRTLDVTTTGEAGVDWANVGAPTTTQNLSGTTISTSQVVASVSGAVGSVTGGVSLTSGERTTLAGVIWNILTSTLTTASSIGKLLVDNVNATISSRSTYAGTDTPGTTTLLTRVPTTVASQTSVDTLDDFVDTEVAAIKAKTDQLVFTAGRVDANATITLTTTDFNNIADAVLKRDWTALSGEAAYSLLNAARMLRDKWNTTGGTLTVYKEDGSTTAWTRTLSTDPTAAPITGAT